MRNFYNDYDKEYCKTSELLDGGLVKTFFGKYIDLSKIVSISDARFIDRMGSGGWYVGFDIEVQLLEQPIKYQRSFEYDESTFTLGEKHKLVYVTGTSRILAVERLQKQVGELISIWIKYKKEGK